MFYWYWELTLRDGDVLEMKNAEGSHSRNINMVSHQYLLSSVGTGAEKNERP